MKKLIFISLIIILLTTSCTKKEYYIETFIEQNKNTMIAITYPVTNIKKLDNEIIKYIKEKYNSLTTDDKELNIDYTFNIISNRYINITLESYLNGKNKNHDINTYIYDKKQNTFLNINDLVSNNSLLTINQIVEKKLNNASNINYDKLTFDENYLYFYIENNNKIETVNVPIYDTEFLPDIFINKDELEKINNDKNKRIIDPNKPVVAITFDDGPSKYTDDILDILEKNNASATFFVLGNKVKHYSSTLKKMIKNGNEIGNHSYNHKSLNILNEDEIIYQIDTTQNIIFETTGYTPKYLRPTYGNTNKMLKEKSSLEIILWNVDPEDWKYKNSKTIAKKVINKTKDESIILLHDTKQRTVKALKIIIKELKENGFQFVTISELKEIQKIRKQIGISNEE